MILDFYDIKPTKTIHHFIITRKEDGHKFIMEKTEKPDDITGGRDDICIRDAETLEIVDIQTEEEITEELETKLIVY